MADCRFQLLGSLKIIFDNEELTSRIPGKKAKLLLVYLVLAMDIPQSRKQISFHFWPDSTEKQALSNLRKLLHDLRECLPQIAPYLEVTPTYIQWIHQPICYSDVREFEQAAQGQTLYELKKAEELYRGELLPGFYEEWLHSKREGLTQVYLKVLGKLISILEKQREYTTALFYANKLLAQNILSEEPYRTLMRLFALNKDMAGVIHIYEQLRSVLKAELGIAPAEETLQLFERLTKNRGEYSTAAYSQTPFIGRMDEWGSMVSVWKEAKAGKSSLLVVEGEAGIGKTRLALELKAWVESEGIQTAFAGCYPSVSSLSYAPVTSWLRSLPLPQMNPVWLSEVSRLLPEVFERYPDLLEPNPILENWQLYRWYEAIERMLLTKQPLLLILDDMQWSDKETLQLLSYLFRGDSKTRLLVIATMRTDEHADIAVGQFVSELRIERKITEIKLSPFNEEVTKRLMAAMVGDALADRNSSGLHAETGGNPLFIVETMREWQTSSRKNEFRLSPLVKTTIENRLSRLSQESIRLVFTAAAIGRPVSAEFMAIVMDMQEEAVFERMEQLVQLKVMQEDRNGLYDFSHDIIRNSAYKLKNNSRRRQCHQKIARSLIAFHHKQPEVVTAEIAYHFELAGMKDEAVPYYEMAATAAEKIYANETRIRYYRKICASISPEQILPILMKLGHALIIVGEWKEAVMVFRQWLERSGSSTTIQERSLCDVALGNCLRLQGEYEEARFHLERALRCFELAEDHAGLSSVYVMLGTLHYYKGEFDKVLFYLMKRNELPLVGNRTHEDCGFFGIIGHLFYDQCEYEQSIHWIKKQMAIAAQNQDKYSYEQAMGLLAMVYMDMDDMDQAFDLLVDKMEISKSIGDRMGFAIAHGMLGKYYCYLGHYTHASPYIVFSLEEAVAIKDWRVVAIMLSYEGRNLLAQQRLEEADLMLGLANRLFKQLRTPYFACETLYFTSVLRQRQNLCESAAEAAGEALEIANRLKRRDMQVNLLLQLSRIKLDVGQINPSDATNQLQCLLEQYPGQQEQAAIRFALWKLLPDSSEHRTAALLLNEGLYRKSGKQQYLIRYGEVEGVSQAVLARPIPSHVADVAPYQGVSPNTLEEINHYLNRE